MPPDVLSIAAVAVAIFGLVFLWLTGRRCRANERALQASLAKERDTTASLRLIVADHRKALRLAGVNLPYRPDYDEPSTEAPEADARPS